MKIIFLDIDGTLVNYQCELPESAVRAVQETRKKGNRVYLTTGRSKPEVYPHLWDIGIDGMIGGNGMYIEDNGTVIQDLCMSKQCVSDAVDWMTANDLGFYLESKNGLFGSKNFASKASFLYGENCADAQQQVRQLFPHMIFDGELYRDDVAKISFCLNPDLLAQAKEKFAGQMKIDSWSATGQKQEFGEFALLGADKVHAVDELLRYLHVSIEDTFAFGDAASDSQMVRYCQVGVAMGNAAESLKEDADYVTDDVNCDGLYNAFAKYQLV